MNNWSFYDNAAKTIPFNLRGMEGKISVFYGINDDPVKVGFDSLPNLPFDLNLSRGYPVIHARIEDYAGSGYRIFCGWIQIITSVYLDSHDHEQAQSETFVSVDIAPAIEESDLPFAAYGYYPQLFDAPCCNLGKNAELRWTADTFLTTVPLRSREEEIIPVAGFRWGYTENDTAGQKPELLPLETTNKQVWNQHLEFLRKEYPNWCFKSV